MQKSEHELEKEHSENLQTDDSCYKLAHFEWWNEAGTGISQHPNVLGSVGHYVKLMRDSRPTDTTSYELRDLGGDHPKARQLKTELKERKAIESKFKLLKKVEPIMQLFFDCYANYERKKIKEWQQSRFPIKTINRGLEDQKQNIQNFFNTYLERIFSKHSHTIPCFRQVTIWAQPLIEGGLNSENYTRMAESLLPYLSEYNRLISTSHGTSAAKKEGQEKNKIEDEIERSGLGPS